MEQCFGILRMLFGNRQRKRRLKHLVRYKDDDQRQLGVEFENLLLDDTDRINYGTDSNVISQEEREFLSKRQYDLLIEQQKKIDEQIDKQLFEEEEQVKIEEDAYYEAQKEAARAASMTLSLKKRSAELAESVRSSSHRKSLSLEEVEDDFEDFLEEVRSRSVAFRTQYAKKNLDDDTSATDALPNFDRDVDGMSSEEDFITNETSASSQDRKKETLEWNSYTSGVVKRSSEERMEPVGNGNSHNESFIITKEKNLSISYNDLDRPTEAERMFSITDDEDMGDFVSA